MEACFPVAIVVSASSNDLEIENNFFVFGQAIRLKFVSRQFRRGSMDESFGGVEFLFQVLILRGGLRQWVKPV